MNTTNERFDKWMENHDTIMGGLDSSQIPPLKTFISTEKNILLDQAIEEIKEYSMKFVAATEKTEKDFIEGHKNTVYNILSQLSKLKELKE